MLNPSKAFTSWLTKQDISLEALTLVNILFGVFNENEDNVILNQLILMAKFYIDKCKLNSANPSLKIFIAKTKTVYQRERQLATKHNKLLKHHQKKNLAKHPVKENFESVSPPSPFFYLNCHCCKSFIFILKQIK